MNEDSQEQYEAPVLSEEGAAVLARAVSRHQKSSATAHDRRRQKDQLRQAPAPVDVAPAARPASTSKPEQVLRKTSTPRALLVLGAMAIVGVLVIGLAVALFLTAGPNNADVQTEVAGVTEESDAGGADDSVVVLDEATPTTTESATAAAEESPPEVVDEAESTEAVVLPEALGLQVYDVDPLNEGTRSFAIRISNGGEELVPTVEGLTIEVELETGERVPAFVRFIHQEIPSGSSAIATVRVEGIPEGPSSAVLVFDGNDLDERALP